MTISVLLEHSGNGRQGEVFRILICKFFSLTMQT